MELHYNHCWFVTFCLEICQAVLGFDVLGYLGTLWGFYGCDLAA